MKANTQKITGKDIQNELGVARTKSYQILKDIKSNFPDTPILTFYHLNKYLGIID